jgi:arylsulfatase A-like enzyme
MGKGRRQRRPFSFSQPAICRLAQGGIVTMLAFITSTHHSTRLPMNKLLLFAALLILSGHIAAAADAAPKPNVVYILADDLGWADVGFHGGDIQTPNLDKLAAAGARLEQFYVQPLCSPTRNCLLTGRYPMRNGLQAGVVKPHAQYGLPLDERTLPQALKSAGYATFITGKWHLGHFDPAYLPTKRGFDHQYGHYNGALDFFTHIRDGGLDWHRNDKALIEEGYSTHLIAAEAAKLIMETGKSKPFFLYVPFNAVHAPLQVPEKYMTPYASRPEKRRLYSGMLAAMDEAIGTIVAALETAGVRQQTLIIFSSDNGGPSPGVVTSNGPLRAGKGTLYEGGIRVPAFAVWEGKIKPGTIVNEPLHIVDWYPTILKLAGASLTQPKPLDGLDAWPTITQGKPTPHREILHNTTPNTGALRMGDWKLVVNGFRRDDGEAEESGAKAGKKNKSTAAVPEGEQYELFNIAQDPNEKNNLAEKSPEKLKTLLARYQALAKEAAPTRATPASANFKVPKVWGEKD